MATVKPRAIGAGENAEQSTATTNQNTDVQTLFEKYGLLCNSEGFYQHLQECWSDSIQMIMMYSDTIKDKIQPQLIYKDYTLEEIKTLLSDYLIKKLNNQFSDLEGTDEITKLYEKNIKNILTYYQIIQKRFIRHYRAEILRLETYGSAEQFYTSKNLKSQCFDDLLQLSIESRSKIEKLINKPGVQSSVLSKSTKKFMQMNREEIGKSIPYKMGTEYNFGGYTNLDIPYLLDIYNLLFGLKLTYSVSSIDKYQFNQEAVAIWIAVHNWNKTISHAMCFYTCGGIDYYYNNEKGNIAFPWRKLLTRYNEETKKKNKPRLIFTYNVKAKIDTVENGKNITTEILDNNLYPFIEYTDKNIRTTITFIDGKEDAVEIVVNKQQKIFMQDTATIKVGKLEYFIDLRTDSTALNLKITDMFEIYNEKKDVTMNNSKFTKSSGRFMRSRLINSNKNRLANLKKSASSVAMSAATTSGGKRTKSVKQKSTSKAKTKKHKVRF